MIIVTISLDTQTTPPEDLRALIKDGQVLHAAGILNARWEDYSALHTADKAELEAVEWDYTGDDTPGALELTIWYPFNTREQVTELLYTIAGVDEVEISDGSLHDGNSRVPLD